jgi:hypothetical protein
VPSPKSRLRQRQESAGSELFQAVDRLDNVLLRRSRIDLARLGFIPASDNA